MIFLQTTYRQHLKNSKPSRASQRQDERLLQSRRWQPRPVLQLGSQGATAYSAAAPYFYDTASTLEVYPDAVSEEHSTQVSYIVKQSANMAFSKAWTVLAADATTMPDAKACGQDSKKNYFMDVMIPLQWQ